MTLPTTDIELADAIIHRLNKLIEDTAVCVDVGKLINSRIPCSKETNEHPTIQSQLTEGEEFLGDEGVPYKGPTLGFLGLLNGLVGTISEGKLKGWGYVSAVFDDDGRLTHFRRTDVP